MALASPDAEGSAPVADEERPSGARAGVDAPRPSRLLGYVRIATGVLLFALVLLAVVGSWRSVRVTISRIGPLELVSSAVLVLTGLAASALTWRVALRELGSTVSIDAASRIYLLGQLGKYIPGSVWALGLQMELAKQVGVPRARGMAASVMAIAVNVLTGLAIGLLVLPALSGGAAWRVLLPAALLTACAVALAPPVLTRLVNVGLRVMRRASAQRNFTWGGVLRATGWSAASWVSYGTSVWLLATAIGAPAGESLPLCIGGVALAMTLGFLVVVAPSGIGVREAVIVAALGPVLDRPEALAVALVARLLFAVADLVAAAAVLPLRVRTADV